ncbi:MAG: HD domain-containing protein [Bacteroidia bacterium]
MKYFDEIYGEQEVDGVIEELIDTSVFQRLKGVHQGGAIFLVNPQIDHTRFEHSVGVMLLIKKLGGSVKEQIAGLIHDISHTAFSHLVDYVFELEEEDYHEIRFVEVIEGSEIPRVLKSKGLSLDEFKELDRYKILENPLPGLSADRIDYTFRDLFQINQVSVEQINWFLKGLRVVEGRLVLIEREYGEWFQSKYRFLTSQYFESTENKEVNLAMKVILKESLEKGIIEEVDFFKDDFHLMSKLGGEAFLNEMINKKKSYIVDQIKMKERSVDPEIIVNDQVIRLSELTP